MLDAVGEFSSNNLMVSSHIPQELFFQLVRDIMYKSKMPIKMNVFACLKYVPAIKIN